MRKLLTESELAAIQARLDASTPGPWEADWEGTNHFEITARTAHSPRYWIVNNLGEGYGPDFDFIGHCREDVPALLAELRYERRRREAAEEVLYDGCAELHIFEHRADCGCPVCLSRDAWRAIVEECEDSWGFHKEITLVAQSDGVSHEEATRIVHGRAQRLVEAIFPELKAKEERRRCVLCGNTNCADLYEDEELGQ